jgi:hypothetical protein
MKSKVLVAVLTLGAMATVFLGGVSYVVKMRWALAEGRNAASIMLKGGRLYIGYFGDGAWTYDSHAYTSDSNEYKNLRFRELVGFGAYEYTYTAGRQNAAQHERHRYIESPLWFPFVLLSVYPIIRFMRSLRGDVRTEKGLCHKCGYDLTGNVTGVCSECGTRIRRKDSS